MLAQRTITFQTGRADLTPTGRATLDRLIATLRRYPNSKIRIEGYTDSDGSAAQYLALSRARATTVRRYLAAHGVRGSNLTAVGFGKNRPGRQKPRTPDRPARHR